ncbi:MAG: general stress protein [Desemzia incerta]|uniref:general stress protein n=1 Tax=Desemzia incerta TaxID=82801 RepID=UPI0033158A60
MQRRVEGTYQTSSEVIKAVERLMNEGYKAEEMVVVTDNDSKHQEELDDLTLVEVDTVDPDEGDSFWEKAKEMLSFGNYDTNESNTPLTKYDVAESDAEQYNSALKNGDILLLVAQKESSTQQQAAAVKQEDPAVIASKEKMKEDYEPSPGDEEIFDPTKAQSAREDKPNENKEETLVDDKELNKNAQEPAENNENDNMLEDEEAPQLTGDETSVTVDEGNHVYPDNINTGYTAGDAGNDADNASDYVNKPDNESNNDDTYIQSGEKNTNDAEKNNH